MRAWLLMAMGLRLRLPLQLQMNQIVFLSRGQERCSRPPMSSFLKLARLFDIESPRSCTSARGLHLKAVGQNFPVWSETWWNASARGGKI